MKLPVTLVPTDSVNKRAALFRLFPARNRGKFIDLHRDQCRGVLGDIRRLGHHNGNRFAHVPDLFHCERHLKKFFEARKPGDPDADGMQMAAEMVAGKNTDNTGQRLGLAGINMPDTSVRYRTAKDGCVQHALDVEVVDVSAAPTKEPAVLLPLDRGAGKNFHGSDLELEAAYFRRARNDLMRLTHARQTHDIRPSRHVLLEEGLEFFSLPAPCLDADLFELVGHAEDRR